MTAEQFANEILSLFAEIRTTYDANFDRIKTIELALEDMAHAIEFDDRIDVLTGYRYTKQIQELRRERRSLKEANEQLGHLYHMLVKEPVIESHFTKAAAAIKKSKTAAEGRRYMPRVLTDLPIWDALDEAAGYVVMVAEAN